MTDDRLKRLRMRSWRRGTKEMDLILGPFADRRLGTMAEAEIDLYEDLLLENDQDLYDWVSGRARAPERFAPLVARIADREGVTQTSGKSDRT